MLEKAYNPVLVALLVPIVTLPLTLILVNQIERQGICSGLSLGETRCPTIPMVLSLTPGILNLVPAFWVLSRNPGIGRLAVLAALLGAARWAAPAAIYLMQGPFVPIDRSMNVPVPALSMSMLLYLISFAVLTYAIGRVNRAGSA
jgi:hypothetical protein